MYWQAFFFQLSVNQNSFPISIFLDDFAIDNYPFQFCNRTGINPVFSCFDNSMIAYGWLFLQRVNYRLPQPLPYPGPLDASLPTNLPAKYPFCVARIEAYPYGPSISPHDSPFFPIILFDHPALAIRQGDREILLQGVEIEEIALDHLPLVAQARMNSSNP